MARMVTEGSSADGEIYGTGQDIFSQFPLEDLRFSSNTSLPEQSDFPDDSLDMATFVNEEYLYDDEFLDEEATMSHQIPIMNSQTTPLALDIDFPDLFAVDKTGHDLARLPWDGPHGQTCNPNTSDITDTNFETSNEIALSRTLEELSRIIDTPSEQRPDDPNKISTEQSVLPPKAGPKALNVSAEDSSVTDLSEQILQQRKTSVKATAPTISADDILTTDLPEQSVPRPIVPPEPSAHLIFPHSSATNSRRQSTFGTSASVESSVACTKGKRKSFGPHSGEKPKRARRVKACIRCRIYHELCDDFEPCSRCTKVVNTAKIFKHTCSNETVDKIMTFRPGNSRAGLVRSKLPVFRWSAENPSNRIIEAQFPFKAGYGTHRQVPSLTLSCRKFVPSPNDVLKEVWVSPDGESMVIDYQPYACHDIDAEKVKTFMDHCQPLLEEDMVDELSDELISLSISEASRYSSIHPDSAVHIALKLRAAVHFSTTELVMVGPDTLGVARVDNEKFQVHGRASVPSVIDFQIDCLAIKHMARQLDILIKMLKQRLYKKNHVGVWYEVFLAFFVLLGTLEKVHQAQLRYLSRNKDMGGERYGQVCYVTRTMISEWEHSAQILIYHFRCVLKGMVPFSLSWDYLNGNRVRAGLDDDSYSYVQNIASLLKDRRKEFKGLRDLRDRKNFEQPLVWISALFIDGSDES